jgi:hypothetical protein
MSWVIQALDDPLALIPLQTASSALEELAREGLDGIYGQLGPFSPPRRYWDVPLELEYDKVGQLLGASFVLGQSVVTQTVSLLKRLKSELGAAGHWIPGQKQGMVKLEAVFHGSTGFSHIEIIDAAANYFKHWPEWPDDWQVAEKKSLQGTTIEVCKAIGMTPKELTSNLQSALACLGEGDMTASAIIAALGEWRGRLVVRSCSELGIDYPA